MLRHKAESAGGIKLSYAPQLTVTIILPQS